MAREPDLTLLGRTIAGKFAIRELIGGGAMGAVYRARQITLDKDVAIKVMHRELSSDPNYVARFLREAKAASRIDHSNSVRVIDFGEESDGLLYLAMELLDGRDLYTLLRQEGPLPAPRVGDIMLQVLAAVAVAHEVGVVHRDMKPENIMIQSSTDDEGLPCDLVKVCDFGVAKLTDRDGESIRPVAGPAITTEGLVVGTPEYMSPEQGRGESLDSRSDIYSIGVILYQMLAGKTPFDAPSALGIVLKHVTEEPMLPSHIRAEADPALEAVCLRAMKKKREERYATAREMRADVRTALDPHAYDGVHLPDARTISTAEAKAIVTAATEPAPAFPPAAARDRTPVVPFVGPARAAEVAALAGSNPPPVSANVSVSASADTAVAFDSSSIRALQKSSPLLDPTPLLPPNVLPQPRWGGIVLGGILLLGAGGAIAYKLRGIQVAPDPPNTGAIAPTETVAPTVHATMASASSAPTPTPTPHAASVAKPVASGGKRTTATAKLDASVAVSDPVDASVASPIPVGVPTPTPPVVDPSLSVAPALDPSRMTPGPGAPIPAPVPSATPTPAVSGPWNKNTSKVSVVAVRAIGVTTETLRMAVPHAKIEKCYRSALNGTGPKPAPSNMTLHIEANNEGRVTTATLDGSPPIPKDAGNCVLKAMVGRQVASEGAVLMNGDIDLAFTVD